MLRKQAFQKSTETKSNETGKPRRSTCGSMLSHRSPTDKVHFNKTNRRTNFPNLFLSRYSTCFGQFLCLSSGVFHCSFGTGRCHTGYQTCMTYEYASAEYTVENSWWWAEELPETCRVSWQNKSGKLVRLLVLLKRNMLRCTVTITLNSRLSCKRKLFSVSNFCDFFGLQRRYKQGVPI